MKNVFTLGIPGDGWSGDGWIRLQLLVISQRKRKLLNIFLLVVNVGYDTSHNDNSYKKHH